MKSAKGGMQSAAAHYSLYCPKCNKPAYKVTEYKNVKEYEHFTKNGSVIHVIRGVEKFETPWQRTQPIKGYSKADGVETAKKQK